MGVYYAHHTVCDRQETIDTSVRPLAMQHARRIMPGKEEKYSEYASEDREADDRQLVLSVLSCSPISGEKKLALPLCLSVCLCHLMH